MAFGSTPFPDDNRGTSASGDEWSSRECYVAVWAYDQLDLDPTLVKRALYRELSGLLGRTPKAVEWKIENVSFFDPRPRADKPISEAPNAQELLGKVFRWYWADRAAARKYWPGIRKEFEVADSKFR